MRLARRHLLFAICTAVSALMAQQDALACACCTSAGERTDLVMNFGNNYVEEIQRLRFDKSAQLFLGEAEPETVKGIATASEKYDLQAAWRSGRMEFSFRDQADRSGTLTLARPKTISIFHVDPRSPPENSDSRRGPVLYKEWRLTSPAAGTGVFGAGPVPLVSGIEVGLPGGRMTDRLFGLLAV